MDKYISTDELKILLSEQCVKNIELYANGCNWNMRITSRSERYILTSALSTTPRFFTHLDSADKFLRKLGRSTYQVNSTNFDSNAPSRRRRSDQSNRLKSLYQQLEK